MKTFVKKKFNQLHSMLDNLAKRNERLMMIALQTWMNYAHRQIRLDLTNKFIKKASIPDFTDWEGIAIVGQNTIKPTALEIVGKGGQVAYKQIGLPDTFDVLNVDAVKVVDKFASKMVKDITVNTRKGINAAIRQGIRDGKSMDKIARELRPLVGLTETQIESVNNFRKKLQEKIPKLTNKQINKKVDAYSRKTHRRRMQTIARTETARAQNIGYSMGMSDAGVTELEFSIALTDYCPICEELNGQRFPTEEAAGIIPVHPNCRCAMLPVIGDEALLAPQETLPSELPGAMAPEGTLTWKNYLAEHRGEKSTSAILYDFYKLRYEKTGKLAPSGLKHLKTHAAKFEATSVKITKPILGLEDVIKPPAIKPPKVKVPSLTEKPKVKPPGVLPKSYFNEGAKDWDKRLAAHKEDLRKRMGFDVTAVKMQRTDLPEFKNALTKFENAVKSYTEPKVRIKTRRNHVHYGPKEVATRRNLNAYYDILEDMSCDDVIKHHNYSPVRIYMHEGKYRANAKPNAFEVNFSTWNRKEVFFHEFGHLMEGGYMNKVKLKCRLWLKQRAHGAKPIPFNKISFWTKDIQLAYKNKFIDPYVGKIYKTGGTEVFSMGMQQFTSYKNMMKFAKKDFDHFAFIHGILTGAI